ncbi:MAG: glycosyltransferase family 4 protein [Bacteroidota bacterium]
MKIIWLSNYNFSAYKNIIPFTRKDFPFHPSTWIVNLASILSKDESVELHIVTVSPYIKADFEFTADNIHFHILKYSFPFSTRGFPDKMPLDILSQYSTVISKFIRYINIIRPDIIHAHGTEYLYGLVGIKSKFPLLISIQGVVASIYKTDPSFRFFLQTKIERKTILKNRFFACRTEFDKNHIRSLNKNAVIFTLHEAINPCFFTSQWKAEKKQTLLFVGSIIERKGIFTLLQSMIVVKSLFPEVFLHIVGDGNPKYINGLKQFCLVNNIDKHICFEGSKTPNEILKYQIDSQVFILPSYCENSPNSIAEAMVVGMPVIGSNVGGIPSMITDNVNGLLFDYTDYKELAAKIILLLGDINLRTSLGASARIMAESKYLPLNVASSVIKAYTEIIG